MDFCQTNRLVTDCLARWERPSVFRWIVVVEIQGEAVGGERPFVIRQMVANRPSLVRHKLAGNRRGEAIGQNVG